MRWGAANNERAWFSELPTTLAPQPSPTIEERFLEFHHANPHVYSELLTQARHLKQRGVKQIGIGLLYERLRWLQAIATAGNGKFKLNNDFRALYSRLIMEQESDMKDFFKVRERTEEQG
tara:strand:+ start:216 stop:575 length:360 start_codon:yes stop_codon:yes gene_type:complete